MVQRTDAEAKRDKLQTWLTSKLPSAEDISISPLIKASTGYASEIHFFDLHWQEAGQEHAENLVIREEPMALRVFPVYDMGKEFHTMSVGCSILRLDCVCNIVGTRVDLIQSTQVINRYISLNFELLSEQVKVSNIAVIEPSGPRRLRFKSAYHYHLSFGPTRRDRQGVEMLAKQSPKTQKTDPLLRS